MNRYKLTHRSSIFPDILVGQIWMRNSKLHRNSHIQYTKTIEIRGRENNGAWFVKSDISSLILAENDIYYYYELHK